ncbi:MAG: hypothetical protein JXR96_03665 [Deltaproteobacteria bacterium]|nr:hypothetical protein [Deltaproteobacteria bacterium]
MRCHCYPIGRVLALGLLLAACSEGSHQLVIVFPDQEARELTDSVHVWALVPGGYTCQDLTGGSASPEAMTIRTQLVLHPGQADGPALEDVPDEDLLFFAVGWTADDARILHGCVASGGGSGEVRLLLEWSCHPVEEIPLNGVDDDCDGLTDDCEVQADCDDRSPCTADLCMDKECQNIPINEGNDCNDENPCTVGDICAQGVCVGQERDCSDYDTECLRGVCDPETGECSTEPRENGTGCDDGQFCTEDDACQAGVCQGTAMDCSDPDPCTQDSCSELEQDCVHVVVEVPGAEGPRGNGTCINGVDDDCDGKTDSADPNCGACTIDDDCEDDNPCTDERCEDNACVVELVEDGTECEDDLYCTVDGQCQEGNCNHAQRDCSALADACHAGVCNETERRCIAMERPDDYPCDDGLYCTVGDRCASGECVPTGDRDCDDSDFCTVDTCDEEFNRCDYLLVPREGAEGPTGDETCENDQDDDCDGLTDTDDGDCFDCQGPEDCNDNNDCTIDACTDQRCAYTPEPDGTTCNDGDPCTMQDRCSGITCRGVPKDADMDGYADHLCGGTDCDDDQVDVNPGTREWPPGGARCTDGLDNDCNGRVDGTEMDCWAPICSSDNWCMVNPVPQGSDLGAIWAAAADDVWFAGWNGTILHYDGSGWTRTPSPVTITIYGIWSASASNLWAVGGDGNILHNTGSGWHTVGNPAGGNWYYGMGGIAANDIWAVGVGGMAVHFTGSWASTTSNTSNRLLAVDGVASERVWVVGENGTIRLWDGSQWNTEDSHTSGNLQSVTAISWEEAWAVGENGLLRHRTATGWAPAGSGTAKNLYAVWASAADDVWAGGADLTLIHYDGQGWTPYGSKDLWQAEAEDIRFISGLARDDVWAVGGSGRILRFDGQVWQPYSRGESGYLRDVIVIDEDDAWAVGDGGLCLHWDGSAWTRVATGASETLFGVDALDASRVWAAGEGGTILFWNGQSWHRESTGGIAAGFRDIDAWTDGSDVLVYAAGEGGSVLSRNALDSWSEVDVLTTSDLNAVRIYSPDVILVAGAAGQISHWDGLDWSPTTIGTEDLWAIGGEYLAGSNGALYEYNGSYYEPVSIGATASLRSIWRTPGDEVWISGSRGTILHFNGSSWRMESSGCPATLRGISGAGSRIFAVGSYGTILEKR